VAAILVVEDNPANMTLVHFRLASVGHTVLTAPAIKGDADRIPSVACDGYITKPLACKEFLTTIEGRLARDLDVLLPAARRATGAERFVVA
jgi:CheY-like chemotaxis protein